MCLFQFSCFSSLRYTSGVKKYKTTKFFTSLCFYLAIGLWLSGSGILIQASNPVTGPVVAQRGVEV